MDLGPVLAKFTVPGPIKTRADLDAALSELLATITVSRDDVASLLSALKGCTQGLMEAILTARKWFRYQRTIEYFHERTSVRQGTTTRLPSANVS